MTLSRRPREGDRPWTKREHDKWDARVQEQLEALRRELETLGRRVAWIGGALVVFAVIANAAVAVTVGVLIARAHP